MDKTMEDKKIQEHPDTVPYIVHESEMARQERNIRRLWVLCILIFVAFVVSNIGWLVYESQFEDQTITQTITQDSGEGGNNDYSGKIVGGDYNGEADNQNNGENKTP